MPETTAHSIASPPEAYVKFMSILLARRLLWSRTREWLLPIDDRRRETFACACESDSRILELGRSGREQDVLLAELEQGALRSDR